MAIQTVKTGASVNDGTGDPARTAFTKINSNFTDSANAASRLVGVATGNVIEMTSTGIGNSGFGASEPPKITNTAKTLQELTPTLGVSRMGNGVNYVNIDILKTAMGVTTSSNIAGTFLQFGYQASRFNKWLFAPYGDSNTLYFGNKHDTSSEVWKQVIINGANSIYTTTTASSANVVITSTGELQRSTSSERYKTNIKHIDLSDKEYAAIRQVKPIYYNSTATADNHKWTWQSFSAEELAAANPTLVLWETEETVIDEGTGLPVTRALAKRRPAGLNLNGLTALLHATNLKQAKLIDDLTARLTALEAKVG